MKGFYLLAVSIVAEVIATVSLKFSNGFTVLLPSVVVAIGYGIAFYFLGKTLKYLPLSIAYAVWSGLGTVLTAVIGIFLFDDPFNLAILFGITLILGGVVLMNMDNAEEPAAREEEPVV